MILAGDETAPYLDVLVNVDSLRGGTRVFDDGAGEPWDRA